MQPGGIWSVHGVSVGVDPNPEVEKVLSFCPLLDWRWLGGQEKRMKPCLRDRTVGCHTDSGIQTRWDKAERSGSSFGYREQPMTAGRLRKGVQK